MAKFLYNNAKNISISYTSFKLNYNYYPRISFKYNVDSCLKSYLINELANKPKDVILIFQSNLLYIKKRQK